MDHQNKSREELLKELEELQDKHRSLRALFDSYMIERMEADEEVRSKTMFMQAISNSTADGYLVVDSSGKKILQNQRTVDLWKIPQHIADAPDDKQQVEHVMMMTSNPQQFADEIAYLYEHPNEISRHEVELRSGTFLERYSAPVMGADGINYGRIWTFRDITKRKQAEKALRESREDLMKLNADKDLFISILAHDLKSPFNSILGFLELLKTNVQKYDRDKIEKQIGIILQSAQSTYALLNDLLTWATTQSGRIPFKPRSLLLSEIFEDILSGLKPNIVAKNILIDCLEAESATVFADKNMLKTVMRNLISNAIKFSNRDGRISISTKQVPGNVTITVSDNGVGMPLEVLDKIFDITQLYTTKGTEGEKGTGFGLLLCKDFIERHGGEIRAESILGQGTAIMVALPNKPITE